MSRLSVGTSGWNYRHWVGPLYPENVKQDEWLPLYARQFSSVELNVTFYRTPRESTIVKWVTATPTNFLFSVKMPRLITHIKRLLDVKGAIRDFEQMLYHFGVKLGAVLIQLPPSLKFDTQLHTSFFELLRSGYREVRYAIEPRNVTWFNERVYEVLRRYNIALCIADSGGRYPCGDAVTSDFVYLRFHGPDSLYASAYTEIQLRETSRTVLQWLHQGLDVYVYFNNDFHGYAVENAKTLLEFIQSGETG